MGSGDPRSGRDARRRGPDGLEPQQVANEAIVGQGTHGGAVVGRGTTRAQSDSGHVGGTGTKAPIAKAHHLEEVLRLTDPQLDCPVIDAVGSNADFEPKAEVVQPQVVGQRSLV